MTQCRIEYLGNLSSYFDGLCSSMHKHYALISIYCKRTIIMHQRRTCVRINTDASDSTRIFNTWLRYLTLIV